MTIVTYCRSSGAARYECAQAGCGECMEDLLEENSGLLRLVVMRLAPGNAEYASKGRQILTVFFISAPIQG